MQSRWLKGTEVGEVITVGFLAEETRNGRRFLICSRGHIGRDGKGDGWEWPRSCAVLF
jgi:hypothetical protein